MTSKSHGNIQSREILKKSTCTATVGTASTATAITTAANCHCQYYHRNHTAATIATAATAPTATRTGRDGPTTTTSKLVVPTIIAIVATVTETFSIKKGIHVQCQRQNSPCLVAILQPLCVQQLATLWFLGASSQQTLLGSARFRRALVDHTRGKRAMGYAMPWRIRNLGTCLF